MMGAPSTMFALVMLMIAVALASQPSFDHQTTTYTAQFSPLNQTNVYMDLTVFYSPDSSAKLLADLVDSATDTVDIGTPNWKSWSGCTQFSGPIGCNFTYVKFDEEFPVFQAALRAIYRGVRVRILSNDFNSPPASGMVTPELFLALAGAELRYYTSTTFMHAKYIQVDGRKASISSVNFSYTSFMNNREAGVILSGNEAEPFLAYLTKVFDSDFAQGLQPSLSSYNSSDVALAQQKAAIQLNIPDPKYHYGAYVTTPYAFSGTLNEFGIITSPDFAYDDVMRGLNRAQTSIDVYIYQITGDGFCDTLCTASNNGVNVRVLASDHIVSSTDYENAQICYRKLVGCNASVYKASSGMYSYNHQKFWVVDGRYAYISTGNWGETDYPDASTFPPYSQSGWIQCNRDFTVYMDNEDIANNLLHVLEEDQARGFPFSG